MNTLYILEDDPLLGPTMQDLVEMTQPDCKIELFTFFADFIAAINKAPPGAAIVDLNVPDRAGPEIVTELRRVFPGRPVFVYSGDADSLMRVRNLNLPRVTTGFKTESFNLVNDWLGQAFH